MKVGIYARLGIFPVFAYKIKDIHACYVSKGDPTHPHCLQVLPRKGYKGIAK